jgi:hypothetical protein
VPCTAMAGACPARLECGGGVMPDSYLTWPAAQHSSPWPPDSRLRGTGQLADDLYLLAHDDRTGKPRLGPRQLGLGLAGGLLAEQLLADQIRLAPGGLVCVTAHRDRQPPGVLLGQISAEPALLPVRDWLEFLGRTSAQQVAGRLEQAGYLRTVPRRIPGRPGRRVPRNTDWAITPISRARAALDPRCPPGQYACALAGLAAASGLAFRRDPYRPAGRTVQDAVTSLAPAMQMLIHQTEVSVAVLSQRT